MAVYLGAGGRLLYTPLRNLETRGCWPTRVPSTSSCVIEIADLKLLIVRYCFPKSNCSHKNSRTSFRGAESGSVFLLKHQLSHCCQALEYDDSVDDRQDFQMMLITRSESPLASLDLLIQAKRLVEDGLVMPEGGSGLLGLSQSVLLEVEGLEDRLGCSVTVKTRSGWAKLEQLALLSLSPCIAWLGIVKSGQMEGTCKDDVPSMGRT